MEGHTMSFSSSFGRLGYTIVIFAISCVAFGIAPVSASGRHDRSMLSRRALSTVHTYLPTRALPSKANILLAASSLPVEPPASNWTLLDSASVVATGETPPWAFQMTSHNDPNVMYGVTGGEIFYSPPSPITFSQLTQLSLDWKAVTPWGGGSPRLALAIDVDGDGEFIHWADDPNGKDGWLFIDIIANYPSFYGPATAWLNTGNYIGNNTPSIFESQQIRVDLNGDGKWDGKTTDNYTHALAMCGDKQVMGIMLVTDGGWFTNAHYGIFEQVVWANNININGDILSANGPLGANNDTYSTPVDTALTVAAPGVLGNDSNPSSGPMRAVNPSAPAHGIVDLNTDGSFTYTPEAAYTGPDSFTYQISDGAFTYNTATVSLNVTAINSAPTAYSKNLVTYQNKVVGITLLGQDPEGVPLTYEIVTGPQNGVLTGTSPKLKYYPALDYIGTDSFTFKVNDGTQDSGVATVNITIRAATVLRAVTLQYSGDIEYSCDGVNYVPFAKPTMNLAPATYNVRFGNYVRNITVSSAADVVKSAALVLLTKSDGATLTGGKVYVQDDTTWTYLGGTDASGGKFILFDGLVGTKDFAMTYAYGRQEKSQNLAANSIVLFNTAIVSVQLENSSGALAGAAKVQYFADGAWRAMGTTVNGLLTKELLPVSYPFALTYAYQRAEKTQDIGANAVVAFATVPVTVQLKNSSGVLFGNAAAQYYAGDAWRAMGTTATGLLTKELLPASYNLALTYNYQRAESGLVDVVANPITVFQTGQVHSASNTCSAFYSGGAWRTFRQETQLLPATYNFRFKTGLPSEETFTIATGTVNNIR